MGLGNLATLVEIIVSLVTVILLVHVVLSWMQMDPYHPFRRVIDQIAEPIVRPFRNLIPPTGGFDFSVMVAMLVIQVLGQVLVAFLGRR